MKTGKKNNILKQTLVILVFKSYNVCLLSLPSSHYLGLFLLLIGLRTRRLCYLANWKKNKIENPYFLFPPLQIFLLIMYRKNKNNKNSTWYLNKPINFSIAAGGQHIKLIFLKSLSFFAVLLYYKMLYGICIKS